MVMNQYQKSTIEDVSEPSIGMIDDVSYQESGINDESCSDSSGEMQHIIKPKD